MSWRMPFGGKVYSVVPCVNEDVGEAWQIRQCGCKHHVISLFDVDLNTHLTHLELAFIYKDCFLVSGFGQHHSGGLVLLLLAKVMVKSRVPSVVSSFQKWRTSSSIIWFGYSECIFMFLGGFRDPCSGILDSYEVSSHHCGGPRRCCCSWTYPTDTADCPQRNWVSGDTWCVMVKIELSSCDPLKCWKSCDANSGSSVDHFGIGNKSDQTARASEMSLAAFHVKFATWFSAAQHQKPSAQMNGSFVVAHWVIFLVSDVKG